MKDDAYTICSERSTAPYRAIETLLKGPEISLPKGVTFKDKDGHVRDSARIKWWRADQYEAKDRLHLGKELTNGRKFADLMLGSEHHYPLINKPVFIGHYWLNEPNPKPLSDNCASLDYSIAKGGKLVAYKWRGEERLMENHFEW